MDSEEFKLLTRRYSPKPWSMSMIELSDTIIQCEEAIDIFSDPSNPMREAERESYKSALEGRLNNLYSELYNR